jgi:hypothetical protein
VIVIVSPVTRIRIPQGRALVIDDLASGIDIMSPDQCHFLWVDGGGDSKDCKASGQTVGMVEQKGMGLSKNPTSLCHLKCIYMAHECDLGWPGGGNVLPSGAPEFATATDQERPILEIVVGVLSSSHTHQESPASKEQPELIELDG